jgi:hypothetical protein
MAEATRWDEVWPVTPGRKHDAGSRSKTFNDTWRYTVSDPIHADRFHYVSFEWTLRIKGGSADFVALKK